MQHGLWIRIQTEVKVTDIDGRHLLRFQSFWLSIWTECNRNQADFSVSLLNLQRCKLDIGWQRLQTTLGLDGNVEWFCLSRRHFKRQPAFISIELP